MKLEARARLKATHTGNAVGLGHVLQKHGLSFKATDDTVVTELRMGLSVPIKFSFMGSNVMMVLGDSWASIKKELAGSDRMLNVSAIGAKSILLRMLPVAIKQYGEQDPVAIGLGVLKDLIAEIDKMVASQGTFIITM